MATQCFLWGRSGVPATVGVQFGAGYTTFEQGDKNFDAGASGQYLNTTGSRDVGSLIALVVNGVTGPTAGREFRTTGSAPMLFLTAPLSAAVTISGTITFNLWAWELAMTDNMAINARVFKISPTGAITEIVKTARTTELGTAAAAANFTATPTSTACAIGDRLGVVIFVDDAGTMAAGQGNFDFAAASAGVDGDTYVTFTETITVFGTPSGTTIYPTTASAGINPGSANEYEAWTSRGAGATTSVTNTVAGPTAAIQCTETAGGTALEWYTKQLSATTLSGLVLVNVRGKASVGGTQFICEIARTDSDGTNATVWGLAGPLANLGSGSETAQGQFCVAGDDLAISNGQRIRIRFFIDDAVGQSTSTLISMASGGDATLYYAGTSGGASGDTYVQFPVTLTEFTAAAQVPYFNPMPPFLAQ